MCVCVNNPNVPSSLKALSKKHGWFIVHVCRKQRVRDSCHLCTSCWCCRHTCHGHCSHVSLFASVNLLPSHTAQRASPRPAAWPPPGNGSASHLAGPAAPKRKSKPIRKTAGPRRLTESVALPWLSPINPDPRVGEAPPEPRTVTAVGYRPFGGVPVPSGWAC